MTTHLESTAGVDMEQYSHPQDIDSPSAPVQPVRIGFEPIRAECSTGDEENAPNKKP